jgi:hypothetical protein
MGKFKERYFYVIDTMIQQGKYSMIESLEQEAIKIAKKLNLKYNGIQQGVKPNDQWFMFTDLGTKSTFVVKNLKDVKKKLINVQNTFKKGKK